MTSAKDLVDKPGFNPGGVVDRVDPRDFKIEEVAFATPPFDWNVGFDIEEKVGVIQPKDQGASGSCGGQAWANLAAVLEAVATGSYEERSAKYVYCQTYVPGGGSYGRDNAKIFVSQGVSRETVLSSYQGGKAPTEAFMERGGDITPESTIDAKLDQSTIYAQDGTDINSVAKAIRDFNGVILGVSGQNNGTWTTPYPKPPTRTEWRHWVYAGKTKMINGVKHIGFLNSWGPDVGEKGWQWLSEAYFRNAVPDASIWSVWTHVLAAPLPHPTLHHTFTSDLEYHGIRGKEVAALQDALKLEGFFPVSVASTGFFGLITRAAVIKYQTAKGITPALGKVGPLTRAELNKTYA